MIAIHRKLNRKNGHLSELEVAACPGLFDRLTGQKSHGAFTSNAEYLEAYFKEITAKNKFRKCAMGDRLYASADEKSLREFEKEWKELHQIFQRRLKKTILEGNLMPRLETLARKYALSEFEKNILATLVAQVNWKPFGNESILDLDVGNLICIHQVELADQIHARRHFLKSSKLVREQLIQIEDSIIHRELLKMDVTIDRRLMNWILGLDTEISELIDGGHIYQPAVTLDQVVLPPDKKALICQSLDQQRHLIALKADGRLPEAYSVNTGLTYLFYGPSGTGKTMLANALARELNKQILLINFPSLGSINPDSVLKMLFREARIENAILFFDECEALFASRENGNDSIGPLLTEIERYDGIVILATNRPQDLDEAMHRRISLSVAFERPDSYSRQEIWKSHVPDCVQIDEDVDFNYLAERYDLTGGLIKNAMLTALTVAYGRHADQKSENCMLTRNDLEAAARQQTQAKVRLSTLNSNEKISLENLVFTGETRAQIEQLILFQTRKQLLTGRLGWGEKTGKRLGCLALLHGEPGTGKSMTAQAIANRLGSPCRIVNAAALTAKYVGETARNIENLFREAKAEEAVVVIDEAESLLGRRSAENDTTSRYANMDVGVFLQQIDLHEGLLILTTNHLEWLDAALRRRARFTIELALPGPEERALLWRHYIPPRLDCACDIDYAHLGRQFEFSGARIEQAVLNACLTVLDLPVDLQILAQHHLERAGEELMEKGGRTIGFGIPV